MKSFSLELLPQETLYSFVVRSWLMSGYVSSRDFLSETLSTAHCQLHANFPSFIPNLASEVGLSHEFILENHTIFPYFSVFLSKELVSKSKASLCSGQSKDLHSQLSLVANRIPQPNEQKYCPLCVQNDIKVYGVAYWHTYHQLPFIAVCIEHGCWLVKKEVKRRSLCLPPQTIYSDVTYSKASSKAMLYTGISHDLLTSGIESLDSKRVSNCYLNELQSKGLTTPSLSVHQHEWLLSHKEYWAGAIPSQLFVALFEERTDMNFPRCLFYQLSAQHHPIKHILVIGQLFGGLKSFLSCYGDDSYQVNRECTGPAVEQARVPASKLSKLLSKLSNGESLRQAAKAAKVSIGYAKSTALQNGFEIERRAQRLFAFERKQILDWLKEGLKTQDIAKLMHCSTGAVEQLLTQSPAVKRLREKLRFYQKRYQHRQTIIDYLNVHKSSTRGQVQKCVNASYLWCFKNDKEWLYLNLPPEIPRAERGAKK